MNKILTLVAVLVSVLFTVPAFAWEPPPSPAPTSWIADPSHVLSDEAHARLDVKLKQINQSSANELAALILPSLDGEDIRDVGIATAKAWGVGKKDLDNGVLIVLSIKDHKSAIETGKGVEGDLPDLKCNDILQHARPYLKKSDFEGALGFIFDNASKDIANHKAEVASSKNGNTNSSCDVSNAGVEGSGLGIVLAFGIFAIGFLVWRMSATNKRQQEAQDELERKKRSTRLRLEREQAERIDRENRARKQEYTAHFAALATETRPYAEPIRHIPVAPARLENSFIVGAPLTAAAEMAKVEEARRSQRERDEENRRRRERDAEDRRRQEREEEDRRRASESSNSSGSSSDWGGSSDNGSFGGGDAGGGGSSDSW